MNILYRDINGKRRPWHLQPWVVIAALIVVDTAVIIWSVTLW